MKGKVLRVVAGVLACAAIGGGLASAANSGSSGKARINDSAQHGQRGPHPGPPLFAKDMTYAEVHTQKDGQDVVVRLDRGEIQSASSSEVAVKENDGQTVTIPVDGNTKVLAGPNSHKTVSDLKAGDKVLVDHEQGKAADTIGIAPPKGQGGPHGPGGMGGPGGPPPADQQSNS